MVFFILAYSADKQYLSLSPHFKTVSIQLFRPISVRHVENLKPVA